MSARSPAPRLEPFANLPGVTQRRSAPGPSTAGLAESHDGPMLRLEDAVVETVYETSPPLERKLMIT